MSQSACSALASEASLGPAAACAVEEAHGPVLARRYSHSSDACWVRVSCEAAEAAHCKHAVQIQRWARRCIFRRRLALRIEASSEGETYVEAFEELESECLEHEVACEHEQAPLQTLHRRSRSSGDLSVHGSPLIHSSWVDTTAQLRVLLVFANPHGTSSLRLQAEERAIREALCGGTFHARITLDVLPAATVDDLAKRLLRQQYDMIHFSGHADRVTLLMQHMIEQFRTEHGIDPVALRSNKQAVRSMEHAVDSAVSQIEHMLIKQHPELERRPTINGNAHVIDVYGPPDTGRQLQQLYPRNTPSLDIIRRTKTMALPTYMLESATLFNHDVKVALDVTIDDRRVGTPGHSYHVHQNISTRDVLDMGVGSLAFEGDAGDLAFVRPESFARMLSAYCPPLRCVILNACGSKLQGGVLSQVVPLTVCFGCKVADRESTNFSKGFYDAIGNGRSYEDAYIEGARRMDLHSMDPGVPFRPSTPVMSFPDSTTAEPSSALVSLFRNIPLLHDLQHFRSEMTPAPPVSQGIVVNGRAYTASEIEEVMNMNSQLKSLVGYGMKVLESKDEEIANLKMQLQLQSPAAAPKSHRRLLSMDSAIHSPSTDRRRVRTSPVKKENAPIRRRGWNKPASPGKRVSVAQRTTAASRAAQVNKKENSEPSAAATAGRELESRRPSGTGTPNEPFRTSASPKPSATKRRPAGYDFEDTTAQRRQPSFGSRVPRFFDVPDSPNGDRPVVSVTYSPRQKPDSRMISPKRVGPTSAPSTPPRPGTK